MLKEIRERHMNVRKATVLSVATNVLQIVAVLALAVMVFSSPKIDINVKMERLIVSVGAVIVILGAVTDIGAAMTNLRVKKQQEALEETYSQLEELNRTMRAQRHDFMNHLQVVYSLIEMEESAEATDYIDKVYGDMQRVNRVLRTDSAAINALLQAKLADCEKREIKVTLHITSRFTPLAMPDWEMCSILGNLIDNAMDAVKNNREKHIIISLNEDLKTHTFCIENNGPVIREAELEKIFTPGFTTKKTGQGMGLFIVARLLREAGGAIQAQSVKGSTKFMGQLPKRGEDEKTLTQDKK